MADEKVIDLDRLDRYDANLKTQANILQRDKAYILNQYVCRGNIFLKCIQAGTTDTTTLNLSGVVVGDELTDGTVKWLVVDHFGASGISNWQANKSYAVNDVVIYQNKIYQCSTAHTSTSTFDATKWTEISAGGGGGISIWQANTAYNVNDVVIDSNLIWQCATAHTSTSTFDESKWVCISGGEISNGLEIITLWEGKYNISNESSSSITNTITLEDSVENYKLLLVQMYAYDTSGDRYLKGNILTIDTSYITYNNSYSFISNFYANSSNNASLEYMFKDSLNMGIAWKNSIGSDAPYITKVQGIRKAKPIVSSGMKYETLWEGEEGNINGSGQSVTINLSESIRKYKKLGFIMKARPYSSVYTYYMEIESETIDSNEAICFCLGYGDVQEGVFLSGTGTDTQLIFSFYKGLITKVIGISEGVQIPTGVQAARVTLWEGQYNTVNSPLQLSDSIENYDQFELTLSNDGTSERGTFTCNVKDIDYSGYDFRVFNAQDTNYRYSMSVSFADSTNFRIDNITVSGWSTVYLLRITGIKYIQPDSYSTEEKLIGTWIDGKPLYRRVFTGTAPSSAGVNTNIFTDPLFTNVDMCYVKDGYIKRDAGSGDIDFYKINESAESAYGYSSRIFISCSESSIRGSVGQQLTSRPLVVIVEYTKN